MCRKSHSAFAGMGDRHVGIGVEALLFVPRRAVLVAGHPEQGEHNDEPEPPTDET